MTHAHRLIELSRTFEAGMISHKGLPAPRPAEPKW